MVNQGINLKHLITSASKFRMRIFKHTRFVLLRNINKGFIVNTKKFFFQFFFRLWMNLYIHAGKKFRVFNFFFDCVCLLKKKIKKNFFSFLQTFFLQSYFSLIIKTISKSGKLYVIPWYLKTIKIYKYFFRFFTDQIKKRSESTLKLKLISECLDLSVKSNLNDDSIFFLAKTELYISILENKSNISLAKVI